jgi:hypothetical protein
MRRIIKGRAGKTRGIHAENHVKLTMDKHPTNSEAVIFESIDNVLPSSLGIKNFCQQDRRTALNR